jgi:uncharacterized RDD family membrane protein YckC
MQVVCAKCNQTLEFSGARPTFCAYCGQPLAGSTEQALLSSGDEATQEAAVPAGEAGPAPAKLGGYRLLRRLGGGGMGTVYEAEDSASGRRVALKLIAPEFARSEDAVERFRQEGRIASMVTHPRCVFVHAVDEEAGQPYIVMELMPGDTLKELVDRRGPLPPEEAVAKILDVLDGLQEAHRLEVIHRDVKPSNCFLEPDGRVKVGDFGLAKSLVKEAHLTRTGAFVGTPHFASPEQVRGEPIDRRTDVYSAAATLFYLLAGRPPFSGESGTATLARIVSDPPPSLRSLRPELPAALDRVVLRGLERDRDRRYPDLESFRQALLALVPDRPTLPGLARRAAAYLIDLTLLWLAARAVFALLAVLLPGPDAPPQQALVLALGRGVGLVLLLTYFTVSEHTWGCTLGKALARLRVCTTRWIDPPGWGKVGLRALLFCGLVHLGWLAAALVLLTRVGEVRPAAEWEGVVSRNDLWLTWGWAAIGTAFVLATMRATDGYRGLHEVLSGTRVAELPAPGRGEALLGTGGWLLSFLHSRRLDRGPAQAGPLPERVGGFAVRGALKWGPGEKVLLGEDASLGRRVFLWLRPAGAPPLDPARRDVSRRTRLRWLGRGRQGELQWDAILAPSGCPLPDFIHSEGTLDWAEVRPLLAELAGELAAACADGTLPPALTTAHVWVQPNGRAQLADIALTASLQEEAGPAGPDQERALTLLRRVAILALEGRPRAPGEADRPVRTWLPERAAAVVNRLLGSGPGHATVEEFRDELALCRAEDDSVT